ncbi:interferon-inducible GTPase 1-like [Neolamprologus brichardi]|uniref:interferon-inducible GTPase 1-like n=1 Tax=Neolamprologus brichardi TaxID=32507 RepID=UPI001643EBD9|nr:interferon-inducible GTPase 1-like [Neolamprologus brichardi]
MRQSLSTSTDDQFGFALVKEEINEALLKNDQRAAAAKITKLMMKEKNITLNIAITGEAGAGKSTFVNALRGLCDDDEGAAPTGVTETTMEVTPYPHPNYPNVMLWDLPGIGSTKFPADKYLELVGFEKFDFFIIISDTRFTKNDVKLAQEIQRMKKKFYFVRSKIDNDINAERRKRDFSEERTLTKIRDDYVKVLWLRPFYRGHVQVCLYLRELDAVRELHSLGAEQLKALLPMVLRQKDGTASWIEEAARSERVEEMVLNSSERRGSADNAGGRVLNQLKIMEGFLGETMQERITIITVGGNETVDKNGRRLGGKRRT